MCEKKILQNGFEVHAQILVFFCILRNKKQGRLVFTLAIKLERMFSENECFKNYLSR